MAALWFAAEKRQSSAVRISRDMKLRAEYWDEGAGQ